METNIQAGRHIYESLVTFDARMKLIAGLAESWKPIDDKTWEFKLRRGIVFHDGSPFTADDVLFTFERVPQVQTASPLTGFVAGKKATKVDDLTIHVTTDKPNPLVPNDLSRILIVSKKSAAGAGNVEFNSGKAAIGTGPFRLVEWKTGDHYSYEANPRHWGGKPQWDKVTIKPIKTAPARIAALLSGEVDLIENVPTTDIAGLKSNPRITIAETSSMRMIFLIPDVGRDVTPFVTNNAGDPLFPNPLRLWEVRKALSKAINRKAIVERIMEGSAVAAAQMVPEGAFGYNPELKPEPYDPEGAMQLLAKVGYADEFRIVLHSPNDRYVNDAKILEAIAQMWQRIGIRAEVNTQPFTTFQPRANRGELSMSMNGSAAATGESSYSIRFNLMTFNREAGFGSFNRGRYSNVRVDDLASQALSMLDDEKRQKLLQQAMAIAMNDVASIPLHFQVATWAMRKGIQYTPRADENTLAFEAHKGN